MMESATCLDVIRWHIGVTVYSRLSGKSFQLNFSRTGDRFRIFCENSPMSLFASSLGNHSVRYWYTWLSIAMLGNAMKWLAHIEGNKHYQNLGLRQDPVKTSFSSGTRSSAGLSWWCAELDHLSFVKARRHAVCKRIRASRSLCLLRRDKHKSHQSGRHCLLSFAECRCQARYQLLSFCLRWQ